VKDVSSRVRSCLEETYKIDEKTRTHTFNQEKCMIPLKKDHPFQENEKVTIIRQKDYDSILLMIKELEHDKDYLKRQIKDLKD
jgi:hypothetical protein